VALQLGATYVGGLCIGYNGGGALCVTGQCVLLLLPTWIGGYVIGYGGVLWSGCLR